MAVGMGGEWCIDCADPANSDGGASIARPRTIGSDTGKEWVYGMCTSLVDRRQTLPQTRRKEGHRGTVRKRRTSKNVTTHDP